VFQPRYRLRGFGRNLQLNLAILHVLLGGLVECNRLIRRQVPGLPSLYRAGIRYVRDQPGQEDWCDVLEIYKQGFADCKSFAAARVAELNEMGVAAVCEIAQPRIVGGNVLLYHIRIKWPNGHIEDPSIALGMPTNAFPRPPVAAPPWWRGRALTHA
jgi:hypothetical protein